MAATFIKIADYTVSSTVATFNFTSIPATYTDLVLVANAASTQQTNIGVRFNSDTGNNYYDIGSEGSGSSITNNNLTSDGFSRLAWITNSTTYAGSGVLHIANYAENKWKALFSVRGLNSTAVAYGVGTWGGTSVISTITVFTATGVNFRNGSVFSLYGIARN